MNSLDQWLLESGPAIATLLDAHREQICQTVAAHFALVFSGADEARPAPAAEEQFYAHVTRRFHSLMLVVLLFGQPQVMEGELRNGERYPPSRMLTLQERTALVHWYFAAMRHHVPIDAVDRAGLRALEATIMERIADPVSTG